MKNGLNLQPASVRRRRFVCKSAGRWRGEHVFYVPCKATASNSYSYLIARA
jgi:hypothetical protein